MRPVPAPRHTSELPWPSLRPVVEDAGEPAGFLDRQVDSVEMTTAIGRGFATDTVAWVLREVLLARRGTRQGLQRRRAERSAVTTVGSPCHGLQCIDSDELTNLHRRNLSYRRDVDDLATCLVERDDLGLPHRTARFPLGPLVALLVHLRLSLLRHRERDAGGVHVDLHEGYLPGSEHLPYGRSLRGNSPSPYVHLSAQNCDPHKSADRGSTRVRITWAEALHVAPRGATTAGSRGRRYRRSLTRPV